MPDMPSQNASLDSVLNVIYLTDNDRQFLSRQTSLIPKWYALRKLDYGRQRHDHYLRRGYLRNNPTMPQFYDSDESFHLFGYDVMDYHYNMSSISLPSLEKLSNKVKEMKDKWRWYLIGKYLLSPSTERLNVLDRNSSQVTILEGELRRFAEGLKNINRRDVKVTEELVHLYCLIYDLPLLEPFLLKQLEL